ncbi:MAG: hypothetical protein A2293_09860, partial [Elusimicrobia bacterium RIFOXYB2_FULL_49_7]
MYILCFNMLRPLLLILIPTILRVYVFLLIKTSRLSVVFEGPSSSFPTDREGYGPGRIYAFWHTHLLMASRSFMGKGAYGVISRSRDGEYLVRLLSAWGYRFIRGSSSRGWMALYRDSIALLNQGKVIGITPDGPRGPFQKVQPGVIAMAAQTGADIVTVGVGYSSRKRLNSWDRFNIPLPFSRIVVLVGEGYTLLKGLNEQAV